MFQFWTKNPPNRTGYWWFKNSEDNAQIIFIDKIKLDELNSGNVDKNSWWGTTKLAEPSNAHC